MNESAGDSDGSKQQDEASSRGTDALHKDSLLEFEPSPSCPTTVPHIPAAAPIRLHTTAVGPCFPVQRQNMNHPQLPVTTKILRYLTHNTDDASGVNTWSRIDRGTGLR